MLSPLPDDAAVEAPTSQPVSVQVVPDVTDLAPDDPILLLDITPEADDRAGCDSQRTVRMYEIVLGGDPTD